MTTERWKQITAALDAVLDRPADQRLRYLVEFYPDDADLRREVALLLSAHDEAASFLEAPAPAYAATFLDMAESKLTDPLIGQVLDGYRINDVLGRGGMGIVYRAEDEELARTVALKMIDPQLARDDSFVRRFRSEARILARIDSPYIVEVHALRSTPKGLFIVMEYVDGGTVGDLIAEGPIPWPKALPIIEQMLRAFEAAHGAGVIHRDIKPGNVMLTRDGQVKVTDFGLAKRFAGAGDSMATRTQGIAGTLLYMSPEQVKGQRDLDHRSDLYATGITAYQMLTGRLPIDRESGEFAIMRAIVEDTLPPPSTYNPGLPPEIDRLIMRSLEKTPEARFQSAREMREAFEAFRSSGATAVREGYDQEKTVLDRSPQYLASPKTPGGDYADATNFASAPPYDLRHIPPVAERATPTPPVAQGKRWGLYVTVGGIVVVLILLTALFYKIDPSTSQQELNTGPDTSLTDADGGTGTIPGGEENGAGTDGDGTGSTGATGQDAATTGSITINTVPADAVVFIDGRQVQPGTPVSLPPGTVEVRVERAGYTTWRQSATVVVGETSDIRATLTREVAPMGRLVLNAPDGGTVSAGGNVQRGRVTVEVPAGERTVTFNHPRYGPWSATVRVQPGQIRELTAYFEKTVNVGVDDVSGNVMSAAIWVDGVSDPSYFTPKVLTLGPGRHTIGISKEGYDILDPPREVVVRQSLEAPEAERLVFRIRKQ